VSPFSGTGQTTIEPELQGRTPRRVRYTGGTQGARLFVWLLLLGGGGLIAHFGTNDVRQLNALQAHGEQTQAHITDRHITHGKHDSYYLDYMFMTDKGMVSDDEEVSHQDYSDTSDGTPLTVTYLPENPDTHRVGIVDDRYIQRSVKDWLIGGSITALVLGLFVFFTEKNFRNHRALLENGIAVTGRITNRYLVQGSKSNSYFVQYEFDGPGGMISGKASVSRTIYDQTQPETPTTILYNPTRPNNNRPYSLLTDVRLA
jgi:hypothetical protein